VSGSGLYLLDTNITGYIISGRSLSARGALKQALEESRVAISAVTEAEILYGLELKPEARRLRASVERLFKVIEVQAWDSAAALAYSRLRSRLRAAGKTLSGMDLMIAAHALAMEAILVTHDNAFQNVLPYLAVVDWASDLK